MCGTEIIDSHCHVFPDALAPKAVDFLESYYKMHWSCDGTLDGLKESVKGLDIKKMVVFSTATKATQVETINTFIASLNSEKFIGFGTLHKDYEEYENEIERIISLGLKGIKIHPDFQNFAIDDEKMLKIYEVIGNRLPVLTHLGDEKSDLSSPIRLSRVIDMFPNLTVIGAHLGGYMRWDEAEECLIGRNLYLDTSSSLYKLSPKRAVELIRKHGVDKVLFGTDYPSMSHREEIELFHNLPLTDIEKHMILYENAAKLFHITK